MTMILSDIASRLASGSLSARDHVESCLAAIDCEDGARAEAAMERLRFATRRAHEHRFFDTAIFHAGRLVSMHAAMREKE